MGSGTGICAWKLVSQSQPKQNKTQQNKSNQKQKQNRENPRTYRHINTNLTALNLLSKLAGAGAALGEDRNTVAVFVGVDQLDGFVESGYVEADEDGAEDLFFVAGHVFCYVRDDGGTDLRGGGRG